MININEQFVNELINEIVIGRFSVLENNLSISNEMHGIFTKIRVLLDELTIDQQVKFLFFLRGIIIETVALILGVIDGENFPYGLDLFFELEYKGTAIQGELQDVFFGAVQDMDLY